LHASAQGSTDERLEQVNAANRRSMLTAALAGGFRIGLAHALATENRNRLVSDIERPEQEPRSRSLPIVLVALAIVALIGWGVAGYVYFAGQQQQRALSNQLAQHEKAEGTLTDLNRKVSDRQAALDRATHELDAAGQQQKALQAQVEQTRSQLADLSGQRDKTQAALRQAQLGLGDAQTQTQALQQQQADNLRQAQAAGAQAEQTLGQGHDAVAAAAKALADAQDQQKATQRKVDQAKATIAQATTDQTRLQADAQDADKRTADLPGAIVPLVAAVPQRAADLSSLQQQLQAGQQKADAAQADLAKAQQAVDADNKALQAARSYARNWVMAA
jgi:chromosome segregation ATPase